MKKSEIEVGQHYAAKVSGRITVVRIAGVSAFGGWNAVNVATGREVRIKSAVRLRSKAKDPRHTELSHLIMRTMTGI